MGKLSILIASPVYQKPEVLQLFLSSLQELKSGNAELSFCFVDANTDEESQQLLQRFTRGSSRVFILHWERFKNTVEDTSDDGVQTWSDQIAEMKDEIIDMAITYQYDALFLVNSDVLLHPDTLLQLLSSEKEVISNIYWTQWHPNSIPLPQVWQSDEYSFVTRSEKLRVDKDERVKQAQSFLAQLRNPNIYEVGGVSGCTLIRRKALLKGVRYERIPNLSFMGEDRHFSIRAAALGIPLYVDTRQPAYHIYTESDLEEGKSYLQKNRSHSVAPITISLCMIVKNEEETLPRCLKSVQGIADEIIIVDTGSTDDTKRVASSFGAKVYDFEWIDDFSAARNFSFSKAEKDFILWLDADDVIEEEDRKKMIDLKKTMPPNVDSVMMNYHLAFQEDGTPSFSLKRNRLVRRSAGFQWFGAVHEYLNVTGGRLQSDIAITHRKEKSYTDRNLQIYRRRKERGDVFEPRDMYYFANELKDHGMYDEAIEQYEQFLETGLGWVEDCIAACYKMSDCYGAKKEREGQFRALFRSMEYDKPRAEVCCRLGFIFLNENRVHLAIFWYELATELGGPPNNGAMVEMTAWTWLPYLQLCICYDRLGNSKKAFECNEKALSYYPDHPSLLNNRKYLLSKLPEAALQETDDE